MQEVQANRLGRQRARKKQRLCLEKAEIFLYILAQSFGYLLYYYENLKSGDAEDMWLPIVCFLFSATINLIIIIYQYSHTAFIVLHILLANASLQFAIKFQEVEISNTYIQNKLFMSLIYFSCMLIGRITYDNYKQTGFMFASLFFIICFYQGYLFISFTDMSFMGLFMLWCSWTTWKYLRLLDIIGKFQAKILNKQLEEVINQNKVMLHMQKQALKDGISDFIFFTQLLIPDKTKLRDNAKLRFYQINKPFKDNFNSKLVGLENILAKMKVLKKDIILKIQRKIYKLLTDDSSALKFNELLQNILNSKVAPETQLQNISSAAQLNQQDSQLKYKQQQKYGSGDEFDEELTEQNIQQNDQKYKFIYDNNAKRRPHQTLGQKFWSLDQLIQFRQKIKQLKKKDPRFKIDKNSEDQYVDHFNIQEILLVILFSMSLKNNKIDDSIEKNNYLKRKMKDFEIMHENTSYSVQIFKCEYNSQETIFFSMNKKYNFNQSYTTNNTNKDEDTQRFFQYFKNRTEKIQKLLTSTLCKFDCIRNFAITENLQEYNNNLFSLTYQLEYLRMALKDMEDYREFLQDQQSNNSNSREKILKIRQQNLSLFKFKQLKEDISSIFKSEVSFKCTQIKIEEEYKPFKKQKYVQDSLRSSILIQEDGGNKQPDQIDNSFLYTDYEKLKRIFILLIENSLSYQQAGIIDIFIKEENQNILSITITDNQNNINRNEIDHINEKGYSEKGFGFAIVKELLNALKPKSVINPLKIDGDDHNDQTKIIFQIAKSLSEDGIAPTITNLSHFANFNGTQLDVLQENKKQVDLSNISQQKQIDLMIRKNQSFYNFNDGSQYNKHHSQLQLTSYLNSPGKKQYSEFHVKLRENLLKLPTPQNFLYFYQKKNKYPIEQQYLGSNTYIGQHGNIGNNNYLNVNNTQQYRPISNQNQNNNNILDNVESANKINNLNKQNNNQLIFNFNVFNNGVNENRGIYQPSFLIVSRDIKILSSLKTLLICMCGSEESVIYSSNKDNFQELLQEKIFEYIFIDQLEDFELIDILKAINSKYRNQIQHQKIIFFDYNGDVQRDLEVLYPILKNDQNKYEQKQDFILQPPVLPQFNQISNKNQNLQQNPGAIKTNNYNEEYIQRQSYNQLGDQQNKDNHKNQQINRNTKVSKQLNSQQDSEQNSDMFISIPNEPSNNQKYINYSPDKELEINMARQKQRINDPETANIPSNMNLIGKDNPTQNIIQNYIQTPQTNAISLKKIQSNQQQQQRVSFQQDDGEGFKSPQLNYKIDEKYKKLFQKQIHLSQTPNPRVMGQDSEQNSMRTSTNRNKSPSISQGPDEAKGKQFNKINIGSIKNSPPNPPLKSPNNINNIGRSQKKSLYTRQEEQKNQQHQNRLSEDKSDENKRQIELSLIQKNDPYILQGSFPPMKQHESQEVAQSIKFFYYTLQYPFGYTQIYEAIYHMNFIKDFCHQNISFINLNTPDRYNSQ